MKNNNIPQTQLWISDQQTLETKTVELLQQQLCENSGCQTCTTCTQIINHEHPWVQWLIPERTYSVDQIDNVIKLSSFKLDPEEKRFIIFENAHNLNSSCANRLLKTIEEPHSGYHFILLTPRPETLPATIISRCVTQKFLPQTYLHKHHEFLQPFLNIEFKEPIGFIRKIDTLDIKEDESKQLVDSLFEHWSQTLKNETLNHSLNHKPASTMIIILKQALQTPPMPGGTKLFWKNLYLTAHHALQVRQNKK